MTRAAVVLNGRFSPSHTRIAPENTADGAPEELGWARRLRRQALERGK